MAGARWFAETIPPVEIQQAQMDDPYELCRIAEKNPLLSTAVVPVSYGLRPHRMTGGIVSSHSHSCPPWMIADIKKKPPKKTLGNTHSLASKNTPSTWASWITSQMLLLTVDTRRSYMSLGTSS